MVRFQVVSNRFQKELFTENQFRLSEIGENFLGTAKLAPEKLGKKPILGWGLK